MRNDRTNDENDRLLRQFEHELDCFHKALPLMKRSPESALYGVMAAYDSSWLPLAAVSQHIDEISLGSEQRARIVVQGDHD